MEPKGQDLSLTDCKVQVKWEDLATSDEEEDWSPGILSPSFTGGRSNKVKIMTSGVVRVTEFR